MHTSEVAEINLDNQDGIRVEASPLDNLLLGCVAFVDGANSEKQLGCSESGIFQSCLEAKTSVGAGDQDGLGFKADGGVIWRMAGRPPKEFGASSTFRGASRTIRNTVDGFRGHVGRGHYGYYAMGVASC